VPTLSRWRTAARRRRRNSDARKSLLQKLSLGLEYSVLIDLERGELIECAFKLSATFAVPDVLYERGLREYCGDELLRLGLRVEGRVLLAALG